MKRSYLQLIGTVSSTVLFFIMTSCEREPSVEDGPYKLPDFKNSHEEIIKSNLEFPSGLSNFDDFQKKGLKSSSQSKEEVHGVFLEGPLFAMPEGEETTGLIPYVNPKSAEYSASSLSTLEDATTSTLSEFDMSLYFSDFDSPFYWEFFTGSMDYPQTLFRSTGLTLDNIVLEDGSFISSSNSSDKLFITNPLGETSVYLQDPRLERTTDIILGTDNKIYAAQAPMIDKDNINSIIFPKRVISIENGGINMEFELPSDVQDHSWQYDYYDKDNWWKEAFLLEKLKIIENSENGKEQFGAEFYVSDLLAGKIYKVDTAKNVEVLAEGLRFPSSLAVDSIGNVFYTTTPLEWSYSLIFNSEIFILNPETGESKLLHTFNETLEDYLNTGLGLAMRYNDKIYVVPVAFDVTNVLYESKVKLEFLFSNSHQGTLKYVSIEK